MRLRVRYALLVATGLFASLSHAAGLARQNSEPWQHYPSRFVAPVGAPNILLIMTDDVGFGAASGFGGLIETPVFDGVGREGLRFNRFHTTAMCSPSRAALLTGRNHHRVGNGAIANLSRDLPGYTSVIPDSAATIADVLGAHGYVSAFLGKNHNTPEWELGAMGPFDHWPTGLGFDYFYGFNAAWADQFAPELVENTTQIEPPSDPGYILDRDLSDRAIEWLRRRQHAAPNAPFLLYLAPGSPHTPQQAPADWIARYAGRFDLGWDAAREAIFARQKSAGVIPADAVLTPRPAQMPAWDSLSPEERRVAARMMEVYAAQLAFHDHQVGRIIAELRASGEYDNTLIIYVQGDNGADIASRNGSFNEFGAFFGEEPELGDLASEIDLLGGPRAWGGYPAAWGWAMNTPFAWGKSMAGQLGGIRSALAVSWPRGIARHGAMVDRFAHITDIAPTIYAAAAVTPPDSFGGVAQLPLDGQSLTAEFGPRDAPDPPRTQYFEMLGSFGYYADGWFIGTAMQRPPWDRTSPAPPAPSRLVDYPWRLYNLADDYSQAHDLSAEQPARLRAMVEAFGQVADSNNVLPVAGDVLSLLGPGMRPLALAPRTDFTFDRSGARYPAADIPPLRGHWRIEAVVETDAAGASGPLFVQGGRFTGWGMMLKEGRPVLLNRPSRDPAKHGTARAQAALPAGRHTITAEIFPDAAAGRFAARVRFAVNGEPAGEGTLPDSRVIANPAWLGRWGLTRLVDDPAIPAACQCRVEHVTLRLLEGTIS